MISLAEKLNEVSEATEEAEKKRVTAENGRVSAETKRQTDTAEAIKKNNAATERANTAASAAERRRRKKPIGRQRMQTKSGFGRHSSKRQMRRRSQQTTRRERWKQQNCSTGSSGIGNPRSRKSNRSGFQCEQQSISCQYSSRKSEYGSGAGGESRGTCRGTGTGRYLRKKRSRLRWLLSAQALNRGYSCSSIWEAGKILRGLEAACIRRSGEQSS